jgi:hypothetical protein
MCQSEEMKEDNKEGEEQASTEGEEPVSTEGEEPVSTQLRSWLESHSIILTDPWADPFWGTVHDNDEDQACFSKAQRRGVLDKSTWYTVA